MNQTITLPRAVVEHAQMWIPLLAEMAGMDPETTTAEFSEFADGRPASEFTIANVITALRAALEQPQNHVPDAGNMAPAGWKLVPVEPTDAMLDAAFSVTPDADVAYKRMLAAAPQPPALEQPQGEQEPVAWMDAETRVLYCHDTSKVDRHLGFKPTVPLYAAPPPARQPLTEDEIAELMMRVWGCASIAPRQAPSFARAIERAHGIGGEA